MPSFRTLLASCALASAFVLISSSAATAQSPTTAPRAAYNFNPDWRVLVGDLAGAERTDFDDAAWKSVTLPYAWNEDDAFRLAIDRLPTGVAWYRKHFRVPPGSEGKKIFLEFEGVRFGADVWVNGQHVGLHDNGVMAFGIDISGAVKPGEENVVAVRTDSNWRYRERGTNQPYQWNDRNFNVPYGGINKRVTLHVADKLYQTLPLYSNLGTKGVYIYATDFDIAGRAATIHVESEVRNEDDEPRTFTFDVTLLNASSGSLSPEGRAGEGGGATSNATIAKFGGEQHTLQPGETKVISTSHAVKNLNFWSWGYGYLYDVVTTLTVDGQPVDAVATRTGFRKTEFANGVFKLNDRTLHLKGYAQRTTNEWPALGVDVPPWLSDFSNRMQVESHGNLVRWMHVTPSKQDVESCDRVGLLQAMPAGDAEGDVSGRRWEQRVLLMRDAIIYNRNNPSVIFYESGNKGISDEHMAEMKALRDELDPHGGRAIGSREMLGSAVAEWGGEMLYINKSATKPLWMTEYSRDEGLRKWWDDFSPPFHKDGTGPGQGAGYNRNQDSHAIEDVVRWYDYWRERPGTGRRVNAGGVNIIFSDTNTHYRGSENYRRSGEVDAMRLPKDGFFAHQVMWNGWVDVEQPGLHVMGHWNYAPDVTKDVYAVSSADKVELLLNGRSLGFGARSHQFLFTFKDVKWEPGTLSAVAYDSNGAKIAEASHETAGEPKSIRLTPHVGPGGLRADQSDVALVDVEVVDAKGRRCPTALNEIDFELTGPAEWRGGIAQGPDNYILSKRLPVECGVNRVLVRSTTDPGAITLTAKSERLEPATLRLDAHAIDAQDGLSLVFADAALEPFLDRGPTPAGDSVTPTRTPLAIARAIAGGNSDRVALAYDDNETTTWDNGGGRETAWIRCELERPARLSEVTMKLADWRNRSYPLRILVDDKPVFEGDSERSLGYVTFTFPPTEGRTVRIELVGASTEGDAFDEIVEVTGQKLEDAAPPRDNPQQQRGALRIVELELYEPLAP